LDRFSFLWLRAIESVGLRFWLYWLGCLLQESVQVASFEESVSIGGVPMHRDIAMGCPFANRVLGYSQVIGCCGCVQIFGKFGHWFLSLSL
jgi:hypothetical protein